MNRITLRASRELRAIPGVRNFGSHIGRAQVADEVVGPNLTELWISIDEDADYGPTVAKVQEVVDGYPGLYRDLLTYLTERIKEVLSGTSATIVVRIYGPDLAELRESAQRVAAKIKDVDGVTTLKVEPQVLVPHIAVRIRPEAAARFGMSPGSILRSAMTLINGLRVGEIYEDQKIFGVAVWGTPHVRSDAIALRSLMIDTPLGGQVPLDDLADIAIEPTPTSSTVKAVRVASMSPVTWKGGISAAWQRKLRSGFVAMSNSLKAIIPNFWASTPKHELLANACWLCRACLSSRSSSCCTLTFNRFAWCYSFS